MAARRRTNPEYAAGLTSRVDFRVHERVMDHVDRVAEDRGVTRSYLLRIAAEAVEIAYDEALERRRVRREKLGQFTGGGDRFGSLGSA